MGIVVITWGADQLTKFLVVENLRLGEAVPVIGELLQLRYVKNPGAAFSIASGFTWVLSLVALGVTAVIIYFAPRIRSKRWAAVFGLVLGGAFGNLTDRLFREPGFGIGHVIDFIQLGFFPAIFNVADIAITVSMALFVLLSFLGIGLDGIRRARDTGAADESDADPADHEPDDIETADVEQTDADSGDTEHTDTEDGAPSGRE